MSILLAFTPFFIYIVASRLTTVPLALAAAASTSLVLLARDAFSRRSVKILEFGTLILFGGLATYAFLTHVRWSVPAVRLRVDLGLLLVVLFSLVIRKPFTLQYARESVPTELWGTPAFLHANDVITGVWAAAFAIMVAVDLAMLNVRTLTTRTAIIVTCLALYGASRFTAWYSQR